MATKKQAQPAVPIHTELIVSKDEFKRILTEQLTEGQKLFDSVILAAEQLEAFKSDYESWTNYVSEYLKHSFSNPNNEYRRGFDNEGFTFMGRIGTYKNVVADYKDRIKRRIDNLKNLIRITDILKQSSNVVSHSGTNSTPKLIASHEVFIVHGHDEEAKTKAARFVEKLGFKPIILHEQASSGKTIIEKIEEYTNVGFGIVLYTPCDTGGKKESVPILKDRARQNVVFEHGYLIGKIGRKNVCALVKGDVETPNDISGVVYVHMDEASGWHLKLAKELRSSGYEVDMNKVV